MIDSRKIAVALAVCLVFGSNSFASMRRGGGGNHHGGDRNTTTSFVVGQVVCTDQRILDITGDYTITGDSESIDLPITVDDHGRLVSTASLTLSDASTTQVALVGGLQLVGVDGLILTLASPLPPHVGGDDHPTSGPGHDTSDDGGHPPLPPLPPPPPPHAPPGLGVLVVGQYDGSAFQTTVGVNNLGTTSTFSGVITPANPARGFTIADGRDQILTCTLATKRGVTLPSGAFAVSGSQQGGLFNGVSFLMQSKVFTYELDGIVSSGTLVIKAQGITTGGESGIIPASATSVSPSAYTPTN